MLVSRPFKVKYRNESSACGKLDIRTFAVTADVSEVRLSRAQPVMRVSP
jgi:hypothetical protein